MKYIAIIGYGVVGGGITAVIEANKEQIKRTVHDDVEVKYILDLRDFPDSPYADRVVHDIAPIIEDSSVLNWRLTATFHSESINRIMDMLEYTTFIEYSIDKNIITLRKKRI